MKYHKPKDIKDRYSLQKKKFSYNFTTIDEHNFLMNIILIASVLSFVALKASLLDRLGNYFFMFTIIFIPRVISNLKEKKLRIIIIYLVIVFSLAYNFIILIYRPEWQHVYPYEFFWQI